VPIAYTIILPVSIFSNEIIGLIYGAKYTGSGVVLSIHIWSGVFVFLGIAKSVWIITEGLSKYALFISVVGAIINITINLLLIPKYGPTGAAFATLFSYICSDYILFLLLPRLRKIGIMMTKSLLLRKCY
jgi:PST family polysaccharide transporter